MNPQTGAETTKSRASIPAEGAGRNAPSPLRIVLEEWSLIILFVVFFAILSVSVEYFCLF